ncbi:hypothetical protein ElyMa_004730800 [Elysia marginata]|uniref:Uncharacterized protein n=1 Tax=Elysia marginata TaxID=1093978 RepID=A0AAV4IDJ0_9GAST|nr:hypothetical protein ElyMa_004730800 [Elysia marginata]
MSTGNPCGVMKPPRTGPGDLQSLPTLPWTFTWPMSAAERLRLTTSCMYNQYQVTPCQATSYPYKANWQFRDHSSDALVHPCYVDMRGGPMNVYNVADKQPSQQPLVRNFPRHTKAHCHIYFSDMSPLSKVSLL